MFDFLVGNDFLLSLISFAVVLIPAVIVHELGHLFAGKSVGITILEFGVGFPPRMAKLFKWGETEFTLNWVPLGGFVLPLGEDFVKPLNEAETESERAKAEARLSDESDVTGKPRRLKAVSEAKPLERIWFFVAGALANFITAIVLFAIVGMTGIPQVLGARVVVAYVAPASPFAAAGLRTDDIIEQINGAYFATPEDLYQQLQDLNGQDVTLMIRRVDPLVDPSLERDPDTLLPAQEIQLRVDVDRAPMATFVRIVGVVEDAPAGIAGIQPGDLVLTFNGEQINSANQLIELTNANEGQEVTLEVLGADEMRTVRLTPRISPPAGQGPIGISIQPTIGSRELGLIYQEAAPQQVLVPLNPGEAVNYAFTRTGDAMGMILSLPVQLIQGTISAEEARPVSIVGISTIGSQILSDSIAENQFGAFLTYIALINIALGVTNLLPLPALDGGRILFVLIEIVRGRPVKPEFESVVHMVGLALLLGVAVLVILNDIVNPITLPQ